MASRLPPPGPEKARDPLPPRKAARPGRLIAVGILAFLLVAALAVLRSPLFMVNQVVVRGTPLPANQLLIAAGIRLPAQFFRIPLSQARQRLLAHPQIQDARLRVEVPGRLVITIQERVPVGAAVSQGGFAYFGRDGKVVEVAPQLAAGLVVLSGLKSSSLRPGDSLPAAARPALDLLAQAGSLSLLPWFSEVHLAPGGRLTVYTRDGTEVLLGDAGQMEEKLRLLRALYSEAQRQGRTLARVDLQAVQSPAVVFR
ncbi:MAG: cell division protein FtsQ/DivIB [Firmicutes bacterium]|nr:cell division protein FtsQ/DivIB [Bacillota bacterium]